MMPAAESTELVPLVLAVGGVAAALLLALGALAARRRRRASQDPAPRRRRAAVDIADDPILASMGLGAQRRPPGDPDQKGRR